MFASCGCVFSKMLMGGVVTFFIPMLYVLKTLFLYVGLPYYFYTRVYLFYKTKWHYAKQTEKMICAPNSWPVIGNLPLLLKDRERTKVKGDNYHPGFRVTRDLIGPEMKTINACFFFGHEVYLTIGDFKAVQELYTIHNKLFDKHP